MRFRSVLALVALSAVVSVPAGAEDRFRLFGDAPPSLLAPELSGLPPEHPLAGVSGRTEESAPRSARAPRKDDPSLPPWQPTKRNFGLATAEVLGLANLVPWVVSRYAHKEPYSYISPATITYNLQTGFVWDNDSFSGNGVSHSHHGALYFNSARTNGYSFWESGAFAFTGSFLFEMFLENQSPSFHDLVNTTMGGMVYGEGQYRMANMLLDNTASGFERFLREAGGLVIDPIGGLNRLIRGEMWKDFRNPPDRFPSRLYVELDGLYRHGGEVASKQDEGNMGGFSFLLRYGDPFTGDQRKPFDVFDVQMTLLTPHTAAVAQIVARGLLVDWSLSGNPSAEQRLGLFMGTRYHHFQELVYGSQVLTASHLMRVPLGREIDLRTEASLLAMPIVAIGVDYPLEASDYTKGRTYDFGLGGGGELSLRVRRREVDVLALGWSLVGIRKANGISKSSRIETLSAEARLPLTRKVVLGAGWSWSSRRTTYDRLPTVDLTRTSWRVFAGYSLSERPDRPEAPAGAVSLGSIAPGGPGRWSATAFGGGFFGTRVHTGPELNVLMRNAPTYGLRLAYAVTPVLSLEGGWSRAVPVLQPQDPATGAPVAPATPVRVNTAEVDGLFGFGGQTVRGYLGLGAGAQNIAPNVPSLDASGATTRFVANVAVGGFYFLTPRVALRADGRYRFMASDNRLASIVCDPATCTPYLTNLFSSAEVTGGVTVWF